MKRKLNQLTLFGTVLVLFILHSCTKDDFIETNRHSQVNNKRNAFEKKIPFSEVNLESKMLGNIKISSENQNILMRTNSQYNTIVIDTTQVSYIERGAYHSYTFLVKNNESENITENLVLSSKADGTYNTALFRYNLTEQDKLNISNNIEIHYTGKLEVVNLESSSQNHTTYSYTTTSSSCFGEVQIYVSCCSGQHYWGEPCDYDGGECAPKPPYTAIVISDDCFSGGSGNGDGSNPGTGDGNNGLPGGGSGNGNNTNPTIPNNPNNPENPTNPKNPETDFGDVITKPQLEINQPTTTTECEDLKSKSQNTDFVAKLKDLKNNEANNAVEAGYVMYNDNPNYSEKQYGGIDEAGSFIELDHDTSRADKISGYMHSHQNNATPKNLAVFSLDDLIGFKYLIENSTVPLEELTIYVTSGKGTYAIKITNKQQFINAINTVESNKYVYEWKYLNMVKADDSSEKQIKELLKFIKNDLPNSPLKLYETTGANFENWKELSLSSNNNVTRKNC